MPCLSSDGLNWDQEEVFGTDYPVSRQIRFCLPVFLIPFSVESSFSKFQQTVTNKPPKEKDLAVSSAVRQAFSERKADCFYCLSV